MSAEPELVEPERPPDLEEESAVVEDRRLRVQAMKLRRLSVKAIAAVLNEPVDTIAADLEVLRQGHVSKYGPIPTLDASQEIGWAVADFEEMEAVAWLEFHALKQEAQQRRLSPMFVARARQGWIRTAAMMRVLRLKLLAEHGYLLPQASSKTLPSAQIPRADELRAMLRAEGLLLEVAVAPAGQAPALLDDSPDSPDGVSEIVDPVAVFMDEGGPGGLFGDD